MGGTHISSPFIPLQLTLRHSRTPRAIVDEEKRIVGVLAGRPLATKDKEDDWDTVVQEVERAIRKAHNELHLSAADYAHRRGPQAARAFGVSMGNGQTVCFQLPPFDPHSRRHSIPAFADS